jgi:hypothetical protein
MTSWYIGATVGRKAFIKDCVKRTIRATVVRATVIRIIVVRTTAQLL